MFVTSQTLNSEIERLMKTNHFFFSTASLVWLIWLFTALSEWCFFCLFFFWFYFLVINKRHHSFFCSFSSDIRKKSASNAYLPTNNKIKTVTLPLIIFCRSFRRHWYQICFPRTNAFQNNEQLSSLFGYHQDVPDFLVCKDLMTWFLSSILGIRWVGQHGEGELLF